MSKVVDGHQGWRLISCIWLHGGLLHLLANMLSLVVIGIRLEQEFGFGMYQNFNSKLYSVSLAVCTNCEEISWTGSVVCLFDFVSYIFLLA